MAIIVGNCFHIQEHLLSELGRSHLPLGHTQGEKHKWEQGRGYHGDRREEHILLGWVSATKKTCWKRLCSVLPDSLTLSPACPHLKLLPELLVDVVHFRDGDVVILSLLLVQQLEPGEWERETHFALSFLLSFCALHPKRTCTTSDFLRARRPPVWLPL